MLFPEIRFPATVRVTEQPVDISGFSQGQKDFYLNLFGEMVEIYRARNTPRVVIGIAGPTGAGKSVMAVLLKEIARQAGIPFGWESVTIDAYHYPNQFLLSHFSGGEPLKQVKGRFDTYDVPALVRDLKAFAAGENVSFPVYSRKLHDPVKNSIVVEAKNVLLVVEGLWLLYDQSGWEAIGPLLDFTFFIDSDKAKTQAPVIKRHMTGGRTFEDAARYYERVDGRNSDLVLTTKHKADKVIAPYYSVR
jgi:pantothenate kinase